MTSFLDRCIFVPVSTGTGSFVVASAVNGFLTPLQANAVNGVVYAYSAELRDADNTILSWEVGTGTYTTSNTTLTRSPSFSSNANLVVNFTSPPQVMITVLSRDVNQSFSITRAQITTTKINSNTVMVSGFSSVGDRGAGALYTSSGAGSGGPMAIQDANGTWFQLVLNNGINPSWFGALADGVTDDSAAFQAAWDAGGALYSTLRVPSGHYAFGSTVTIASACFFRSLLCDPGAVFMPLSNSIAIFTLDCTGTNFAFNHFEGASFENPLAKTGCSGIRFYTASDTSHVYQNNKFVNLDFHNYENGILLDRAVTSGETLFDWNTFNNISYLDCNYGFRSDVGSGTGNVFSVGPNECTTAGFAWFGGPGPNNVGDITISNIQFANATDAIYLDSAASYRANITITGCQADASVTNFITAHDYNGIHMAGNNWGGNVFFDITGGTSLEIDGKDASHFTFGSFHQSVASTTIDPICTVTLPNDWSGVSIKVVTEGLIQGRGSTITESLVLIRQSDAPGDPPVASVTKLASLFNASGEVLHTATVAGSVVTINATYGATGAGQALRHQVVVTSGATFTIVRLP